MEMFELRYFLGVAHRENIHQASKDLHVSPASLSKAINRLETELGIVLFTRRGRNIQISNQGKILMRKASLILQLEEAARVELSGEKGALNVNIVGPEVILLREGLLIANKLKKKYPLSNFEFKPTTEQIALEKVASGEAHFAIVACDIPGSLTSKALSQVKFVTCAGGDHPLAFSGKSRKAIPIKEILGYQFVCPSTPLFGQVNQFQSPDGWRDDKFPRKIGYVSSSLRIIDELVQQGKAIAYLPDYHVDSINVSSLKVTGCPYVCEQSLSLVAKNPAEISWMRNFFE